MPLKEVDWDNYEFRCHYLGKLMTKTRGKSNLEKYKEAKYAYESFIEKLFDSGKNPTPTQSMKMNELEAKMKQLELTKDIVSLSPTCKKTLMEIYTQETTGRKKNIESFYIDKGLKTEEESITKYSLFTGAMYRKNKQRVSNGFLTGEIDFEDEEEDMTIDTKSSWDAFTFDATVAVEINSDYDWQGQGYMWLKNRKKHRIAYCLNNTPKSILDKLINRLRYNFVGDENDYKEAEAMLLDNHIFDDLPLERKIRVYDIERDEDKINQIKVMVPHFRNYLKNIKQNKIEDYDTED